MVIYEFDICKIKFWLGFFISVDVINVWMYEESVNFVLFRILILVKILF